MLMLGCGGFIAVVTIIVLFFAGAYNSLVVKKASVDNAYSKIDTALQRRYDLIPNVVNTAKGYMAHETEVFAKIADARSKIGSSTTPEQNLQAQSELTSAVSRLLVLTENYPQLKANEQMNALMTELEGSENRIFVARNDYNAVATAYNTTVKSFPTLIFAALFGHKEAPLFQAEQGAQQVPKVDFSK